MDTLAIEAMKNVARMLASSVPSPVLLICIEDGTFQCHQMGKADFPDDVVQAVLKPLTLSTGEKDSERANDIQDTPDNMQLSAQPASLLDDINEMDTEDDDEYDEIAKIIDTYDEEQNSCDAKSDH
ncbi:hypothetical protein HYPSUDRAFT_81196, partial [Hypholoma sublateritium FD-334 SS-4]